MAKTQALRRADNGRDTPFAAPLGEPIVIPGIDAAGEFYPIEKMEAHRRGVLHQAISVFVFSEDLLLIQQRAMDKYHCGGLWANTCCTHPHWGEDPAKAASRRLGEELGFTVPLSEMRVVEYRAEVGSGLIEHERVHMFVGRADHRQLVVAPDAHEVAATRWISAQALHRDIERAPETYTPWFRIYLERFPSLAF